MLPVLDELKQHLDRCIRADIPWFQREKADAWPVTLTLHLAPEAGLPTQAFEIVATPAGLTLRAGSLPSLHNAVYTFLDEAFGVRWLWPGELGTVTPTATDVSWPVGIQRREPAWLWRRLWTGGAFWTEDDSALAELKGGVSMQTMNALRLWQQRNRLGGLNIADGHRWGQICSPLDYGESHPEYFALVDGERDATYFNGKHQNQPCTANPDVLRLTADYIVAQFRARPELDGFSFAVNDGGGFCECDACRSLDAGAAVEAPDALTEVTNEAAPGHAPGARPITDRMFTFANEVAARVAETYPDKVLLFLVYGPYRKPPAHARLHPNIMAQFCAMSWSHADPDTAERDLQLMTQIAGRADQLGIYDYFVNGKNGGLPRGFARTFHQSLRRWQALGYRYFATQAGLDFATNGFAYATAARALWDGELPFDDILDDYCQSGFGPAAGQVKRTLAALLERWEETQGGQTGDRLETQAPRLYDAVWRQARRAELALAEQTPGLSQRARGRVRFLAAGLDFLDLLCAACAAVTALVDAGAPIGLEATPEALAEWAHGAERRAAIETAVARRQAWLDWLNDHRDGFYVSAMWADYQRLKRHGLLGGWLDALAAGDA
jgi:hypothetical protein